jgi:hypothetical protein
MPRSKYGGNTRRSCNVEAGMNRDLFTPVVPLEITHPLFRGMKDGPGHEAARQMMNLVFANFHDVDKSFIREFQTGGFS